LPYKQINVIKKPRNAIAGLLLLLVVVYLTDFMLFLIYSKLVLLHLGQIIRFMAVLPLK
jgi:hypothetical protein